MRSLILSALILASTFQTAMGVRYDKFNLEYVTSLGGWEITDYLGDINDSVIICPFYYGVAPVKSIGNYAFIYRSNLRYIELPLYLTHIKEGAFYNCHNLETIEIPESVTTIGDNAFSGCIISRFTIPENVTSIGFGALTVYALEKVTLPLRFKNYTTQQLEGFGISDYVPVRFSASRSELDATLNDAYNIGTQSILSNPNVYSLYTTSQIQNMAVGDLVLTKNANGSFTLNYDIEQSADLQSWSIYAPLSLSLTNLPPDKAFVRIKAKQ
jgi:hypothetical protein